MLHSTRRSQLFAIRLSLAVGMLMLGGKWLAYLMTDSTAILSDAAESVIHVVAVAFAFYSMWLSHQPADASHPYGHGKITYFSAGAEGFLILLAAGFIIIDAVGKLVSPVELRNLGEGTLIIAGASVLNLGLGWYLVRRGKRFQSLILIANGKHVLTDSWTSFGVVAGLGLTLWTGWVAFDPLIAIAVALNIVWSGVKLIRESVAGLMDESDPTLDELIRATLEQEVSSRGLRYHQLRYRKSGNALWVEFHLLFPPDALLKNAHRTATDVEQVLASRLPMTAEIITHLESIEDHDEAHAREWAIEEVLLEFTPTVYEHAAAFLNRSPWEVSRDGELLAEAHAAAFQHYHHAPVVVGIDLYNVEAEAYGATVEQPVGNLPPSVEQRLCHSLDELLALPLLSPDRDGRLRMILEAALAVRSRHPVADVRVPISGPFSIASTLLGFEPLLYAMLADPEQAAQALDHLAAGQSAFCRAAAALDLEVLLFESAASPPLLSPSMFRDSVLPSLHRVMEDATAALGRSVGCIIGGNTVPILASVLETGPSYLICPMETDRLSFMETMRSHPEVTVRINTPPEMYLPGPWEPLERELVGAAELARGRPRTLIGTGVLAYETDPARVARASEFVRALE